MTPHEAAEQIAALLHELNSEGFLFFGILKVNRGDSYAYVQAATDGTVLFHEVKH